MKIIGFSQLRNELSNQNLENWFKCMDMCDYIYIFDQNSDDGSKEVYKQNPKCVVIESPINNFANESLCKAILLSKLLVEHPDTDWIFWMDGDYLLDGRFLKNNFKLFYEMCEEAVKENVDGICFGHYNLWRSDTYYRTDSGYHNENITGRISLWRNNGNLEMRILDGLHKDPTPSGIDIVKRIDCNLIHRGFATDYQIISKYKNYKSFGQNGWKLDRIVDEKTLEVEKINLELLPEWFTLTDDVNPKNKSKIIENMQGQL